jgi:molybdopterin synthase catalytic subunit
MQFRLAPQTDPSTAIKVTVRLFAQYAELAGTETLTIELPPGANVGDAVAAVRRQVKDGQRLPTRPLAAVNLAHVLPDHRLADGDQVALLPPLAGG